MHQSISSSDDKLRETLTKHKLLNERSAQRAAAVAEQKGIRFDRALLALGLVEEPDLLKVVAEVFALPYVAFPNDVVVDKATLEVLSTSWCRNKKLVPLISENETACLILTSDPCCLKLTNEVAFLLDRSVSL